MKSLIRRTLAIVIAFGSLARVQAQPAARVIRYSQTDIITIRAKSRFSTLIVLPSD